MNAPTQDRMLSIGEFAAATQLTPKALRLYDEQGLLHPATTDAANGYRYYRVDQVVTGRLVRSLREMRLSLLQIAHVLQAEPVHRELLLREFLHEAERRLAHERAAYQSALLLLNNRTTARTDVVTEGLLPAQVVSVWEFSSDRASFHERYRDQLANTVRCLRSLDVVPSDAASCLLLEPLADEASRLELRIPIDIGHDGNPRDVTVRSLAARRCAIVVAPPAAAHDGFVPAIDALFDWFDRHGSHPLGQPEVLLNDDVTMNATVRWTIASTRGGPSR